jgi:hypothetical protein
MSSGYQTDAPTTCDQNCTTVFDGPYSVLYQCTTKGLIAWQVQIGRPLVGNQTVRFVVRVANGVTPVFTVVDRINEDRLTALPITGNGACVDEKLGSK